MKTYFRFFVIFLVFSCWISYTASAQVVLIYTGNTNWITPAEATTEAGTTKSLLQAAGIQAEITENENRVKQWMLQTASDGSVNVLILYGVVPVTIYPSGNAMPDGSVAEKWIETRDGNTILNHADYFGYWSTDPISNGIGALQNLMDIPNISLFSPSILMFVTTDGSTLTPSLVNFQSDRPLPLNQLQGDWFAEKILASNTGNARATLADPVVVRDGNRGRIAIVHQTAWEDNPKGEVAGEIIVNYLLADASKGVIPDKPGPKIEGPWLWMIAPTGRGGAQAAASRVDFLAQASGDLVTEQQIATKGATPGEMIGNKVWTPGKLAPTGGDNITQVVNATDLGQGNIDNHVAYGSIVLASPRRQKTTMYVGSDDAVKVWLNGVLVHSNPITRGADDYQDSFPVVLKRGTNILLVAVYQYTAGWSGFFGFKNGTVYSLPLLADAPASEGVIPDTRLAAAVRKASGLTLNARITKQHIQKLTTLDADDRQIKDLTGLEYATQLKTLRLWDNQIRDVSPLAGLTNLTELYLNGNQISDFTPIAGLTKLRELGIGENKPKIRDITVLRGLKKIVWLNLYDGQIRDISPLAELTQLESLYLERNQIRDVSPLARLTRLKDLRLAENNIRDVSALTGLVNLEKLLLAENPITDTSPLASLTKLVEVDIEISKPIPVVHVESPDYPPMYWVNTNNGTFHRLVGTEVEDLVPSVRNATSLAIDVENEKLYWTEQTSKTTGKIRRVNLDGTNPQLVKDLTSVPHSITLDPAGGKIYITNAWGKIQRLNVDGSNFQPNLITELDTPRGLALDVAGGKVYWTEASGRIRRANLNGSNIENVVTGLGTPIHLAIFGDTVYWTEKIGEDRGEIRSANLNGNPNVTIRHSFPQGFPVGIAVDTLENTLYWTTSRGSIGRSSLDGSTSQPDFVTGLSAPGAFALSIETKVVPVTDAVLSISPSPATSPAIGERLTLNLKIAAGETVAGYQATVQFDATALRYVSSANGDYLPAGALFVEPVVEGNFVRLNAASLAGESNGNGTLTTLTFEVIAAKASAVTLSDVLLSNSAGEGFIPGVENAQITEPAGLKGDVNGDGIVNIQDLVLVASNLSQTGQNQADINGDSIVNIQDLVLVAGALGTAAAAPSLHPQLLEALTAADVRLWLTQAQYLSLTDPTSQRGILFLEQLLASVIPQETVLLSNYPNPFNPETWIPYQLAKSGDVKITIYDARGIVVRGLELGYRQAGHYTNRSRAAYWDGCNGLGEAVASGIYFYQLETDTISALRKMVILK